MAKGTVAMENALKKWQGLHKFYMYSDYLTKDLAGYVGVNPRTIQRWIKGKNSPSDDQLKKIESFLSAKTSQTDNT